MNKYVCFYKDKRIDVEADTMYAAQQKAAAIFKARKSYDVNVVLAELGGVSVVHNGAELN